MTKKADSDTKRKPTPSSEEYERFERLTKHLLSVPKKEIRATEKRAKKKPS